MRRERIRRNRRTLYLTLAGIGAIILFIGVFIWLVLRGAKVQGPVASSSSSSASSTSAVTQSFKSGTYTATGDVTDENGVHHDLTVYVKLTTAKTYTRLLIIDAHSQPQVINDTGSIKQKKGKLTLVSDHANVYTYTTTTTYKHKQAATVDEYSAKDASGTVLSYTTALKKELNNTISLKGKTPHNYHYLTTSLPLQRSKKKLVSLADFKTSQTASSVSSSSVISSVPSSTNSKLVILFPQLFPLNHHLLPRLVSKVSIAKAARQAATRLKLAARVRRLAAIPKSLVAIKVTSRQPVRLAVSHHLRLIPDQILLLIPVPTNQSVLRCLHGDVCDLDRQTSLFCSH